MKELFALFSLVFIFSGLNARSFFHDAQFDLYRSIQLNGGNKVTRLSYIKETKNFIREEGFHLKIVGTIPILEFIVCGENAFKKGDVFFIDKNKLCSAGVAFFPGANVFVYERFSDNIKVPEGWQFMKNGDEILFFKSNVNFSENTMPDGRKVKQFNSGGYFDSFGKAMYPRFIYKDAKWNQVIPLRESFDLEINDDDSFNLEIFTSSSFPFNEEELLDVTGLKSDSAIVGTSNSYTYIISGLGFKGIRVPGFGKNDEHCVGRYVISINALGNRKNFSTSVKKENYSLDFRTDNNGLYFEMKIEQSEIDKAGVDEIYLFMKKNLPVFYRKEN